MNLRRGGNAGVLVKALSMWVCRPRAGAGVFEKSSFKRHDGIILAGIGIRFAAKHSLKPKFTSPSIIRFANSPQHEPPVTTCFLNIFFLTSLLRVTYRSSPIFLGAFYRPSTRRGSPGIARTSGRYKNPRYHYPPPRASQLSPYLRGVSGLTLTHPYSPTVTYHRPPD